MRNSRLILWICVLMAFLNSCTDSNNDKPVNDIDSVKVDTIPKEIPKDTVIIDENPVKVYSLSQDDKAILDLLDHIQMGFSFTDVRSKYKALKGIRPEEKNDELAEAGLTESVCKQSLFGGEASAEFNFKNDSLYSYFFTYNEKDSEKSEQVFQAIKKYYSSKWGDAQLEKVEEENHYSQNYIWTSKKSVLPYVNHNLNTNAIIWGKRFERVL
jgi:hypothetical protein